MAQATLVKGIQVVLSEEEAEQVWDTVPVGCCWDLQVTGEQQRLIIGVAAGFVELYAENQDEAVEIDLTPDSAAIEEYVKLKGWLWNPKPYLIVGDY